MKKILSFVIPIVCALLIIWLGFRVGSTPQNVIDPDDETLLDEIVGQETTSIPEIFHGLGSPNKGDAVKYLQSFELPGCTLLDCTDVYGAIPGMSVYGFFPGENLTEDAIWTGTALMEVFLYVEVNEEDPGSTNPSVDSTVLRISPQESSEEECKVLLEKAEELLRFSAPNATPAEFDLFTSGEAYKALMKRCRSYTDPDYVLQPGTAVNEVFVAGEESVTLISYDVYRYVEITLHTPADSSNAAEK